MKKFTLILVLFLIGISSTEAQTNPKERTVTVAGTAPLEKTIEKYRIKATLSMDQVYYADTRMENFSLGYQRDGTVLYYVTSSKEIAMKLVKTNLQGVQLQFQVKQHVSPEKNKAALELALKDAMNNANSLCKAINTSVGEIMSISSNQYQNEDWTSYYTDYQEQFTVNVVYQMK